MTLILVNKGLKKLLSQQFSVCHVTVREALKDCEQYSKTAEQIRRKAKELGGAEYQSVYNN